MTDFVIDDELEANWAIKKIGEHQHNIELLKKRRDMFVAVYKRCIENADKIFETDSAADQSAIDNLTAKLLEFANHHMPDNKRSWKFPEGTIKFSAMPPKFFFKDNEIPSSTSQQLIDYLAQNDPAYVKSQTKYTADWAKFRRKLSFDSSGNVFNKETGELVSELRAFPSADKFSVIPLDKELDEFVTENF